MDWRVDRRCEERPRRVNGELLPAGRPVTCEPLTCTRDLGVFPVANRPLAEIQRIELARAGLALAVDLAEGVFIRGDAWLSEATLAACVARSGAWVVRDAQGEALAWSGLRRGAMGGAAVLPAGEGSFLIRYPWDLLRINEVVLGSVIVSAAQGEISPAAHIEGVLVLGPRSRVLPGVYVEGTVVVGSDCKVGPNCYLRGSTSIGDRCHIGQAVEIKNSIIMNGVGMGHLSYCGDSIVGEHANLGAGTITANFRHDGKNHRSTVGGTLVDTGRRKFGAIIGDHVHTGIHTAIYPGRKIWPGLMTRPGTVVQRDIMSADA